MSEKFKVSPPVRKKGPTEPIEQSANKSGKMFDALKKLKEQTKKSKERAGKISEQANALKSYGDIPVVEKGAEAEKIALKKREKREKALTEKERLLNKLMEQGLSNEGSLAFESAYNPKIAPKIKQILTDQKLNIRKPETWNTVHKLLMTPSEEAPYFCEAYVDAYKDYIPVAPLVPKEEGVKVAEGEFKPLDLSMTDEEAQSPEALVAMARVDKMMEEEKGPRGLSPDEEITLTSTLAIVHPGILRTGWTDITDLAVKSYVEKHRAEGRNMEDGVAWMKTMGEVDEMLAKEPSTYVADFEKMDLEGENIISGDEGEKIDVAKKTSPDEGMARVTGVSTRKAR